MRTNYPYLNDLSAATLQNKTFLEQLEKITVRKEYVKITLLDWLENPIKEIQGEISGGSISKDGSSSVRRTGSLSTTLDPYSYDIEDLNFDFAINKKVFIEIGIKNSTDYYSDYPILWFPQGVFFISDFSCSINANSAITASISLKDKMMMLNGDIGGKFTSATVLDEADDIDEETGKTVSKKVLIYNIIQELVHHFGGEPLENILIEDIPDRIKSIMKWTGNTPLYLLTSADEVDGGITYTPTIEDSQIEGKIQGVDYLVFTAGQDVGYIYSDFIWNGELVANAGDNICGALDTIKQALGNFEYFYDEFGVFHFREIKNNLNKTQTSDYLEDMTKDDYVFDIGEQKYYHTFSDNANLISVNVTPQYGNVKNDYIVQGMRKMTGSDVSYPVYYHLVIDNKPETGNIYNNILFYFEDENSKNIRAGFYNDQYFSKEDEYSNYYNITNIEVLKDPNFIRDVLNNSNLKTLETLTLDFENQEKNDLIFFHTVKKIDLENSEVEEEDLIAYLESNNLIKNRHFLANSKNKTIKEILFNKDEELDLNLISKDQTELDAILSEHLTRNETILGSYIDWSKNLTLGKYNRTEEQAVLNEYRKLDGEQSQDTISNKIEKLFRYYLGCLCNKTYDLSKAYNKIFEVIKEKPLLWPRSVYFDLFGNQKTNLGYTYMLSGLEDNLIHFYEYDNDEKQYLIAGFRGESISEDEYSKLRLNGEISALEINKLLVEEAVELQERKNKAIEDKDTATEEMIKVLIDGHAIKSSTFMKSIRPQSLGHDQLSVFGVVNDISNYETVLSWIDSRIKTLVKEKDKLVEEIDSLENKVFIQAQPIKKIIDLKAEQESKLLSKVNLLSKEIQGEKYQEVVFSDGLDYILNWPELSEFPNADSQTIFEIETNRYEILSEKILELIQQNNLIKNTNPQKWTSLSISLEEVVDLLEEIHSKIMVQIESLSSNENISIEKEDYNAFSEAFQKEVSVQEEIQFLNTKKVEFANKKKKIETIFELVMQEAFLASNFDSLRVEIVVPYIVQGLQEIFVQWDGSKWSEVSVCGYEEEYSPKDWRTELYMQGLSAKSLGLDNNSKNPLWKDTNFYFEELDAFWPTIYNVYDQVFYGSQEQTTMTALCDGNYFLDFIEPASSLLGEFSVENIGRRQKIISDDKINCLFTPEVPDLVILNSNDEENFYNLQKECIEKGQEYIQVNQDIYWALSLGGYKNAAFDQMKYELYLGTNYNRTLSLTAIPIYYLEPNSRIIVGDKTTNTYGNFMAQNISLQLGAGSSMSISANEIFERF